MRPESENAWEPPKLRLQPLVHVENMPSAARFYERLGGTVEQGSPDSDWLQMRMAGGELSLLAHPPNPEQSTSPVELTFVTDEPLEEVEDQLRRAGVVIVQSTAEVDFGRQLLVKSPDGLLVKINQLNY